MKIAQHLNTETSSRKKYISTFNSSLSLDKFPKIMCCYKQGFTHPLQPEFWLCFNDYTLCILIQTEEVSVHFLFMHSTFSISVLSECEENCTVKSFLLPIRFSAYMKNVLLLACVTQTKVDEPRKELAARWTIDVQFQADLRTILFVTASRWFLGST
jgi:hypothetical protein